MEFDPQRFGLHPTKCVPSRTRLCSTSELVATYDTSCRRAWVREPLERNWEEREERHTGSAGWNEVQDTDIAKDHLRPFLDISTSTSLPSTLVPVAVRQSPTKMRSSSATTRDSGIKRTTKLTYAGLGWLFSLSAVSQESREPRVKALCSRALH